MNVEKIWYTFLKLIKGLLAQLYGENFKVCQVNMDDVCKLKDF